jgi:hypothetical protein
LAAIISCGLKFAMLFDFTPLFLREGLGVSCILR